MDKKETLNKINKELKIYINEASFISNKCRNQMIKVFEEEFQVHLDIKNYKNVDLSIQDDYRILYRDDFYKSDDDIDSLEEVVERYQRFQEKADKLISKKEKSNHNTNTLLNILNLIMLLVMFVSAILVVFFGTLQLLNGNFMSVTWFIVVILPIVLPKFKENLRSRIEQAKSFLKRIMNKDK